MKIFKKSLIGCSLFLLTSTTAYAQDSFHISVSDGNAHGYYSVGAAIGSLFVYSSGLYGHYGLDHRHYVAPRHRPHHRHHQPHYRHGHRPHHRHGQTYGWNDYKPHRGHHGHKPLYGQRGNHHRPKIFQPPRPHRGGGFDGPRARERHGHH
ncbi:MAG: hypothetical protein JSU88_09855 [Nitrospinaceae bacterium]|nr:MAG: hypothetical protein JSU88_09855 [Nitrospinaceae bacterium]